MIDQAQPMSPKHLDVARALADLDDDKHPDACAVLDSLRRVLADRDRRRRLLSRALNIDETECDGPPIYEELLAEVERLLDLSGGAADS